MRNAWKQQGGFALVEVLIASAVLLFAMVGISLTAISMSRDRGVGMTQVAASQIANEYLNTYTQFGLAALTTGGPDGGLFGTPQYVTPATMTAGTTTDNHSYFLSVYVTDNSGALGVTSKLVTVVVTYTPQGGGAPVTQSVNAIVSK